MSIPASERRPEPFAALAAWMEQLRHVGIVPGLSASQANILAQIARQAAIPARIDPNDQGGYDVRSTLILRDDGLPA